MFTKQNALVAVLALSTVAFIPAIAQATPYTSGSFAFGEFTSTTSDVTTTTSYVIPSGTLNVGSGTGDMAVISLPSTLSITSPLDFSTASGFGFTDTSLGTFTPSTSTLVGTTDTGSGAAESASATWYISGNFLTGTFWDNSGSNFSASETWVLSQTGGPGSAISMSGTFASPAVPPPQVPEPATVALFGAGLLGLAALMRHRGKSKNKSAA